MRSTDGVDQCDRVVASRDVLSVLDLAPSNHRARTMNVGAYIVINSCFMRRMDSRETRTLMKNTKGMMFLRCW